MRWDYIQRLISNKICVRNCANVLDGVNRVVMRYYAFPCNAVRAPEHLTVNQGVTGSSPVGGVIEKHFGSEPQLFSLKCFLLPKIE